MPRNKSYTQNSAKEGKRKERGQQIKISKI